MSLTDNPAAVEAAIAAFRRRAGELTMLDIHQGPGEGNYDRIEQLRIEAAIEAAEAVQRADRPTIEFLSFDEQDTMVMQEVGDDEGRMMDRYEALQHSVRAHGKDTDKCGALYVLHPLAVARAIEDNTNPGSEWREDGPVVALLHDVWEDTDYDLPTNRLTVAQYQTLQAVTRLPDETYQQYIDGICGCQFSTAIIVKLADLWHNLRPARQGCLSEDEQASLEQRYLKSRDQLWTALGQEWWPA